MKPLHPIIVRVAITNWGRNKATARGVVLLSTLVALVLFCGCASLRPPDTPPLCEQPSSSDAVGWGALGWVLEVIGPRLSNR